AGGLLAASQTTGSWIAELRPGACRHWVTATAAPCTSIFKPVAIDQELTLGPNPTDRFDPRAPWWRHELLHRAMIRDPARLAPAFAGERDALEASWFDAPPEPERAFEMAEAFETSWLARLRSEPLRDHRPGYVRRYWSKRDRAAGIDVTRLGDSTEHVS